MDMLTEQNCLLLLDSLSYTNTDERTRMNEHRRMDFFSAKVRCEKIQTISFENSS